MLRPFESAPDRLGRDRLLGAELAVDGAVSQTGFAGDCVNAGGADAPFAEQTGRRGQYLAAILRRLFPRNPHPSLPVSDSCFTRLATCVLYYKRFRSSLIDLSPAMPDGNPLPP